MKRYSWKYIAGLFDGEGCIDVQRVYNKQYPERLYVRPRARIAMADSARRLLEELQANFGGHLGRRDNSDKNPVWQNATTWEILSQKDITYFLGNIVDHLHLKREQAKLTLWWFQNMSGRQSHIDGNGIMQIRQMLCDELKAMKRDPQRLSDRATQRMLELMR